MKHRFLTLLVLLAGLSFASAAHAAETFKVDPIHSNLLFRIKHKNAGYFYGRFNNPTGTFTLDDQDQAKSSFSIEAQAKNVDTAMPKRDDHLRSSDFFNAEQFPTIAFKSTSVKKVDERHYEVSGTLTMHGETRPVTVKLEQVGKVEDGRAGTRTGLHGTFEIKRSDFGITFMPDALGDEVQITVAIQGTTGGR
jgi:polyisoprenoid-binding protein YceI